MKKLNATLAWWLSTAVVFGLILMLTRELRWSSWLVLTLAVLLVAASAALREAILKRVARSKKDELLELLREREEAILASEGGSPDFPIVVDTPVIVDGRAKAKPCPLCGGKLKFEEQTVDRYQGRLLRRTHLQCVTCGVPRRFWFRIAAHQPN